jgi:hypothetical protein
VLTGLGLTNLTERANLGRAGNNMAWISWKFKLGRVKNAGLTGRRFISVSGYGDGRDRPPPPPLVDGRETGIYWPPQLHVLGLLVRPRTLC